MTDDELVAEAAEVLEAWERLRDAEAEAARARDRWEAAEAEESEARARWMAARDALREGQG